MLTQVKMKVTPELSERVQKIVFANGGCWGDLSTKIDSSSKEYLFIDYEKLLYQGDSINDDEFDEEQCKQIDAYTFIAAYEKEELKKKNEMLTQVKMKVTPELSKRVQKIVFANGGKWVFWNSTEICNTEASWLFINPDSNLYSSCTEKGDRFYEDKCKEISAYAFIISKGTKKRISKYKKEVFKNKILKKKIKRLTKEMKSLKMIG